MKTFLVTGKTGIHVIGEENGELRCSCAGWRFRKRCSHVDEIVKKRKEREGRKHEMQEMWQGNGVLEVFREFD
jgi:hypothetical protein